MNKRDIIITAVLINAGLLVVLFISALKPQDPSQIAPKKEPIVAAVSKPKKAPEPKKKVTKGKDLVGEAIVEFKEKKETPKKKAPKKKAPEPVVVKKVEEGHVLHEVKSGDALEKLAKNYGTSVDEIMKLNDLTDTRLKIGQSLRIRKGKPKVVETPKVEDKAEYYVVRSGDSPWTIAVKNHIKVDDLLRLNNLNEEKARKLKPGDRLRIK